MRVEGSFVRVEENKKNKKMKKGFTLIELLIVIGILAILATTVVLVLNPAQILAESRDTQRVSDLGTVNSALGLYLATVPNPTFGSVAESANNTSCGSVAFWRSSGAGATLAPVALGFTPFAGPATAASEPTATEGFRDVDGSGWVSAGGDNPTGGVGATTGFNLVSGGSPLGNLPTDPSGNSAASAAALTAAGHFYAFQCGGTTASKLQYEIDANMESTKFSNGGSADVELTDGGNAALIYEIGTAPGLTL